MVNDGVDVTDRRKEKKFEVKGGKVYVRNGPTIWLDALMDADASAAELARQLGVGAHAVRAWRKMVRESAQHANIA